MVLTRTKRAQTDPEVNPILKNVANEKPDIHVEPL